MQQATATLALRVNNDNARIAIAVAATAATAATRDGSAARMCVGNSSSAAATAGHVASQAGEGMKQWQGKEEGNGIVLIAVDACVSESFNLQPATKTNRAETLLTILSVANVAFLFAVVADVLLLLLLQQIR